MKLEFAINNAVDQKACRRKCVAQMIVGQVSVEEVSCSATGYDLLHLVLCRSNAVGTSDMESIGAKADPFESKITNY